MTMNAINDYKSMIDEVSRALYVFAFSTETNSLTVKDALKSWTDEIIGNYANRVMNYDPALRIKNEILDGTPDNPTILRRIELIDYELSMKPLWQPQYQWQWNTELFSLPYAERNDKGEIIKDDNGKSILTGPGKPIFDILVSINNEKWAWMVMQQLERLATALNFTVKSVEDMLNSLYEFAGGLENESDEQKEQTQSEGSASSCNLQNKNISQLFATLDDYNSFFDDGDLLDCAGWARKAWDYCKKSKLYFNLRGDKKLLYGEIQKFHPKIAKLGTFTKTLNNLYRSTL